MIGALLSLFGGILLVFGALLLISGGTILIRGKDLLGVRLILHRGIFDWGKIFTFGGMIINNIFS